MVRFLLSRTPGKSPHTSAHMRVHADTPPLLVRPQISTLRTDANLKKSASVDSWIYDFVGMNIKGASFIFGWGRAVIISVEKRFLNQLLI